MDYGIATRCLEGMPIDEAGALMHSYGMNCCELCFTHPGYNGWQYNGVTDFSPQGITAQSTANAVDVLQKHGIRTLSLGLYTNLLTPDEKLYSECLSTVLKAFDIADRLGIPYVASEIGFRPECRGLTVDTYESDYARFFERICEIERLTAQSGTALALEACVIDIIPSAKRLSNFLSRLKTCLPSSKTAALLDPANFIANSDESDMLRYLGGNIAYIHGKDRRIDDCYGRLIGDGDVDWTSFFIMYAHKGESAPFILEYATAATLAEAHARVRNIWKKAGIIE